MASCQGTKSGGKCGRLVLKCGKCSTVGCGNKGCSNAKLAGGKCSVCGNIVPISFFARFASLFSKRGA